MGLVEEGIARAVVAEEFDELEADPHIDRRECEVELVLESRLEWAVRGLRE